MSIVPRIYIDPFGTNIFKPSSSKSIFKEQHLHSNVINSHHINQLTNVFNNDAVIDGLNLKNTTITNNNRRINFLIEKGRLIQDNALIDINQDININIDIFSEYAINQANTTSNYFRIAGNQVINFPIGKQFAIFGSSVSSNNHRNWIVNYSELDGSFTRIYTHNNITSTNTSGLIVNHNFQDETTGTILLMSKYQFQETMHNNPVIFTPIFITSTMKYYPEFDPNQHRILYGIIYVTFDLDNFIINPTGYAIEDTYMSVFLKGKQYNVKNLTSLSESVYDCGVID